MEKEREKGKRKHIGEVDWLIDGDGDVFYLEMLIFD